MATASGGTASAPQAAQRSTPPCSSCPQKGQSQRAGVAPSSSPARIGIPGPPCASACGPGACRAAGAFRSGGRGDGRGSDTGRLQDVARQLQVLLEVGGQPVLALPPVVRT